MLFFFGGGSCSAYFVTHFTCWITVVFRCWSVLDIVPQTVAMACEEMSHPHSMMTNDSSFPVSKGLCFGELSLERCVPLCDDLCHSVFDLFFGEQKGISLHGCVWGPVNWRAENLYSFERLWSCAFKSWKVCLCVTVSEGLCFLKLESVSLCDCLRACAF